MSGKERIRIAELLNNPIVQKATSNINQELVERRQNMPPKCDVFHKPYTRLEVNDKFNFLIDREAEKQLPDIINNSVQIICGLDSPEESFKAIYHKKRHIGIVFSGGPAPGGSITDSSRRQ